MLACLTCGSRSISRQGDGLDIIQPGEVNVIIIAGMGSVKINEILSRAGAVLQQADRLVLQPSVRAGQVRRWLRQWLGRDDEDLVIDDERFRSSLPSAWVQKRNDCRMQPGHRGDLLLEIGHRLLEKKHPLLAAYLDKQIRDMESVLIALRRALTPAARQRKARWAGKITFYKAIINELNLCSEPRDRWLEVCRFRAPT